MNLEISEIHMVAKDRPNGYIEDVMLHGIISQDGRWLEISNDDYYKLKAKYDPHQNNKELDFFNRLKNYVKPEELKEPTIGEMTSNLAGSLINWTKSGFQTADDELLKTRLDTCNSCEFWDQNGFFGSGRCNKCGCSTQAKLRMATEKCPIGKW